MCPTVPTPERKERSTIALELGLGQRKSCVVIVVLALLSRTLLDHDSVAIERRGSAGNDNGTGQHGIEAEMCGPGNDAARSLPTHKRLGDDAANWRGTILGGDRRAH